jgi:hypothetical protein
MAKKDELSDVKDKLAKDARAVGEAAKNQQFLQKRHDDIFGAGEQNWEEMQKAVGDLDEEFNEVDTEGRSESLMEMLRQKFEREGGEVRVMQVGPGGRLVDVSDKVNLKDLRPEHIDGIQVEDGSTMPIGRSPQSKEAALRLLSQIMPGLRLSTQPKSTTTASVTKMEAALAESDRILAHWKK